MSQKIVILGAGESGLGTAELASKRGYNVFVSDSGMIGDGQINLLRQWDVDFEEGHHTEKRVLDADYIVKSPGIPDSASIIQTAVKKGIPVISEIEFAYRHLNDGAKIIAITGTNGKTTTTLLTSHLLQSAGLDAVIAGNVGYSFAKRLASDPHDIYVVEVSSFQLDGIIDFKPDVAVLLNITPDHLDRYDNDFEQYVDSKFQITKNLTEDKGFIYFAEDPVVYKTIKHREIAAPTYPISINANRQNAAFIANDTLNFNATIGENNFQGAISTADIGLIGRHNMINSMSAVLACGMMGLTTDQVIKGFKTFKNAEHRLEKAGEINGISFINDSKATNVDAVYYALEGIDQPIIWVAGGTDKGNDYNQIRELVDKKVKGLISIGVDDAALKSSFPDIARIGTAENMKQVVDLALEWGENGDVVLLSPACASFDRFRNYQDRGNQFKNEVAQKISGK